MSRKCSAEQELQFLLRKEPDIPLRRLAIDAIPTSLLLTLNIIHTCVSMIDFEQVNVSWERAKLQKYVKHEIQITHDVC